jgi:prefoldin beta subunit
VGILSAKIPKDAEQKIQQLQLIEQNLQNFLIQKQNFQVQLAEIDSALTELNATTTAYKIVGNIMVAADKTELEKELQQKKELTEVRIQSIERQEVKIREKAEKLQKEALGALGESEENK